MMDPINGISYIIENSSKGENILPEENSCLISRFVEDMKRTSIEAMKLNVLEIRRDIGEKIDQTRDQINF